MTPCFPKRHPQLRAMRNLGTYACSDKSAVFRAGHPCPLRTFIKTASECRHKQGAPGLSSAKMFGTWKRTAIPTIGTWWRGQGRQGIHSSVSLCGPLARVGTLEFGHQLRWDTAGGQLASDVLCAHRNRQMVPTPTQEELLRVVADQAHALNRGGDGVRHQVLWAPEGTGKTAMVEACIDAVASVAETVVPVYVNFARWCSASWKSSLHSVLAAALTGSPLAAGYRKFSYGDGTVDGFVHTLQFGQIRMLLVLDEIEHLYMAPQQETPIAMEHRLAAVDLLHQLGADATGRVSVLLVGSSVACGGLPSLFRGMPRDETTVSRLRKQFGMVAFCHRLSNVPSPTTFLKRALPVAHCADETQARAQARCLAPETTDAQARLAMFWGGVTPQALATAVQKGFAADAAFAHWDYRRASPAVCSAVTAGGYLPAAVLECVFEVLREENQHLAARLSPGWCMHPGDSDLTRNVLADKEWPRFLRPASWDAINTRWKANYTRNWHGWGPKTLDPLSLQPILDRGFLCQSSEGVFPGAAALLFFSHPTRLHQLFIGMGRGLIG